jgi:Schwannomin-interacting protein 1
MNLQICFMNEAASDSESSDSETCPKLSQGMSRRKNVQRPSSLMSHRGTPLNNNPYSSRPLTVNKSVMERNERGEDFRLTFFISFFTFWLIDGSLLFYIFIYFLIVAERPATLMLSDVSDNNFFTHQARLQIEARMALAQAKDMAHMQMEVIFHYNPYIMRLTGI